MAKARTLVGLDVHASKVVAAMLDQETGELRFGRTAGETDKTVELCASLERPVRVAYEAGPTGFGLARALTAAGIECIVAAPGKIPRAAQDRVKTDRRDAEHLVRLLLAGRLEPVRVPSGAEEGLRDLVRAREDVRGDLMRARHRVSKMLLRHDRRFSAGQQAWSQRHRDWLAKVRLDDPVAQLVLCDYLAAVEALVIRRDELERRLGELIPSSPWSELVPHLHCLRGIDTLSAVGLCAEVGDFERFRRPGELMSYLGLVPSEHSSGERRRLGAITRRARVTPAGCSSRPPGTTAQARGRAASSPSARRASPSTWSRSPGRPSSGSAAPGGGWPRSAASAARSSRSRSRASWPASSGRSRGLEGADSTWSRRRR
jgi:transposase